MNMNVKVNFVLSKYLDQTDHDNEFGFFWNWVKGPYLTKV